MNIEEPIHRNVHANIHLRTQELLLLPQTVKDTGSGRLILPIDSGTTSGEKQAIQIQSKGRWRPPETFP